MVDILTSGFWKFWIEKRTTIKSVCHVAVSKHHDADSLLKQAYKMLCNTYYLAKYTPASVGESIDWTYIVKATENRASYLQSNY
jgi:hypothetical protein